MNEKDILAEAERVLAMAQRQRAQAQVKTMTASCPTNITQGTVHTITVARDATNPGTPNYTYKWLLDDVEKGTFGPTADVSHAFTYTFSEAAGSHIVKGRITDSCASGAKTDDEICTINIIVCPVLQTNLTVT